MNITMNAYNDSQWNGFLSNFISQSADNERAKVISNLSDKDLDLYKAFQSGSFDLRGRLGQEWSKSSAAKSEEYRELKGQQLKKEFRAKWAKTKFEQVLQSKTRTTKIKEEHLKKGRYMSFRRIWEMEGLDDEGFKATKNHVSSCLKHGGDFLRSNHMSGRVDFLYFEVGFNSSFEELFELKTEEVQTTSGGSSAASAPVANAPADLASLEAKANSSAGKNRGSKRGACTAQETPAASCKKAKDGSDVTPEKDDERKKQLAKDIAKATSDANKLKVRYHEVVSGTTDIMKRIKEDSKWEKLQVFGSDLQASYENVEHSLTAFAKAFVTNNITDKRSKANLDGQGLLDALRAFKVQSEAAVAACEKQIFFLRATHAQLATM